MHRKRLLFSLVALAIVTSNCSNPKAPGTWIFVDTGVGDAFTSVNFVDPEVGWLNGFTDRDYQPPEEAGNQNQNSNTNSNLNQNTAGKSPEKKEDPLKANQGFEVLQTTDGGQTWRQIPDQFKHKIRSVWFTDRQQGWALTIDRDILHTSDGGTTWELQRKAGTIKLKLFGNPRQPEMDQPEQIDRVFFQDAEHGWAWGGGRKDRYTEQPGTFLATIDGGRNWNSVDYPFEQNVWSIFFLDNRLGWANDADGGFYKTSDGGLNWAKIEARMPELKFDSIFFISENLGWLAGHSGRMAQTTDGGRSWRKLVEIKPEFKVRDIAFVDEDHGWAVGDNGSIIYTEDGGAEWINVGAPIDADLKDIFLLNDQVGWAVGLGGAVLRLEPIKGG